MYKGLYVKIRVLCLVYEFCFFEVDPNSGSFEQRCLLICNLSVVFFFVLILTNTLSLGLKKSL